jgi:hypothetical protein
MSLGSFVDPVVYPLPVLHDPKKVFPLLGIPTTLLPPIGKEAYDQGGPLPFIFQTHLEERRESRVWPVHPRDDKEASLAGVQGMEEPPDPRIKPFLVET